MALFAHKLIKGALDDSSLEVNNEMGRVKANGVTPAHLKKVTASGITTGVVCVKHIATTELEALLSSAELTLFTVEAGDIILSVELAVLTAAGSTCVVDIGIDAVVDGTTKDIDALIDGANVNAAGLYKSNDTVTDATAPTYTGADLDGGPYTCVGGGNILIKSSTDQDSASFVGSVTMYYIPA